jgi:hypothetical protein
MQLANMTTASHLAFWAFGDWVLRGHFDEEGKHIPVMVLMHGQGADF